MCGLGHFRQIDTLPTLAACPLRSHRYQIRPTRLNVAECQERDSRSHETRIAGQVLSPISEIVCRHEYHRKRDTHPVVHSDTESYVARTGKERRYVRRIALCSQVQRGIERTAEELRPRDTQWSNMTVRGNVGVAHAIVFRVKDDTPYPAVVDACDASRVTLPGPVRQCGQRCAGVRLCPQEARNAVVRPPNDPSRAHARH